MGVVRRVTNSRFSIGSTKEGCLLVDFAGSATHQAPRIWESMESLRVGDWILRLDGSVVPTVGDYGEREVHVTDTGECPHLVIRFPVEPANCLIPVGADLLPLIQWLVPSSAGGAANSLERDWSAAAVGWLDQAVPVFVEFLGGVLAAGSDDIKHGTLCWASIGVVTPAVMDEYESADESPFDYVMSAVYGHFKPHQPVLPL